VVRLRRVERDAEDLAIERRELLDLVTQALALDRSARGVGHRVPPEQHPLATEIGETDRSARVVDDAVELGGSDTGLQHARDDTAARA
jgi:hypothetical protein